MGIDTGSIKKKITDIREGVYEDLEVFFPAQFINPLSQSYWRQQKQKLINILMSIIEEKDYTSENEKIDSSIRRTMKIKNFMGSNNDELRYDKDFEINCIILGENYSKPVKQCTVKEYFTLMKIHDDRIKRRK